MQPTRTIRKLSISEADQRRADRIRLRKAIGSELAAPPMWPDMGLDLRLDGGHSAPSKPRFVRRAVLSQVFVREETPAFPADDLLDTTATIADMTTVGMNSAENAATGKSAAASELASHAGELRTLRSRRVDPLGKIPPPPHVGAKEPAIESSDAREPVEADPAEPMTIPFVATPSAPRRRFVDPIFRELRKEILAGLKRDSGICLGLLDPDDAESIPRLFAGISLALCEAAHTEGANSKEAGRASPLLLVDTSFADRSLTRAFAASNLAGLGDVLIQESTLDEAIVPTNLHGVSLLPCGTKRPRELRGLTASDWERFLAGAKSTFAYTLLSVSAESPQTRHFAGKLDRLHVCVRLNQTPRTLLAQILQRLQHEGAADVGCLVTDVTRAA